jgi:4-amino-4-deoxy-L-arabinose transferase-like glycosyltransferase
VSALRRFAAEIGLAALAAFGIRLLYILVVARAPAGIGGDAGFYHSAANLIADGRFYYRGIFGHAYRTAEHPPLYPLLLSVSSVLGGDTLLAHRIVSCALGAVAVALVGVLGRRVGGERTGLLAALVAAVYPPFVTADGLVMSEPLFTLTVAASLLAALAIATRPTVARAALLGALIGLTSLTRGEALLLVPLLAWPVAFRPPARRARRLLAATLATALVIAPWVIRNAIVFHRAIFATDASTLIAGANCRDTYYGHDIGWWSLDCLARARSRQQLDVGDASTRAAFAYARDHVTRLPLVAAVRVLRTFDLYQPLRQGNREPRRRWVDIVGLAFFYPLLALAMVGLARRRPRIDRQTLVVLLAPVAMVIVVSAVGWGIGRFRIAADISIILLAVTSVAARPSRPRDLAQAT